MPVRSNGLPRNIGEITQSDIAKLWGVTRSRVFKIEQQALRKIRRAILADPDLRQLAIEACGRQNIAAAESRTGKTSL